MIHLLFYKFYLMFILFLRERESVHTRGGGAERERETENLKQALHCQHKAGWGWGVVLKLMNHEIMT